MFYKFVPFGLKENLPVTHGVPQGFVFSQLLFSFGENSFQPTGTVTRKVRKYSEIHRTDSALKVTNLAKDI